MLCLPEAKMNCTSWSRKNNVNRFKILNIVLTKDHLAKDINHCNPSIHDDLLCTHWEITLYVQCLTTIPGRLLNSLWKWGNFDRAKSTLKMLLAFWFLLNFFKRLKSFNNKNLGSVGQRAAKLPAIKLWEWFDRQCSRMRADWFEWQLVTLKPFNIQILYLQKIKI